MKINIIKGDSRGHVNPDWLSSYHTYSFGRYYDPSRMGFGVLRVVNDDTVAGGKGFDFHQHDNMEIVSIPLSGGLLHKDSMGNEVIIKSGEVQAMSAGTGVMHMEYNDSETEEVKFLQIWIETRDRGINPDYSQKKFDFLVDENDFGLVVAPNDSGEDVVTIHQDAWMNYGFLQAGDLYKYELHSAENGIFVFVLNGSVSFGDVELDRKDAVEISEIENLELTVGPEGAQLLIIEIPLK